MWLRIFPRLGSPPSTTQGGFRSVQWWLALGNLSAPSGVIPPEPDRNRGDGVRRKRVRTRNPYREQRKLYYLQLQEELNRQLEAKAASVETPRAKRRIVTEAIPRPEPVAMPPMVAGEASRLIRELLASQARMKREALNRELMRMAEEMARQQDEDDAIAVLLAFD